MLFNDVRKSINCLGTIEEEAKDICQNLDGLAPNDNWEKYTWTKKLPYQSTRVKKYIYVSSFVK